MNRIDHIVIAAGSLAQGVDYIRGQLGVDIPRGGCHRTMATHNHLMQLGDDSYLELIAIDPAAEAPAHPRWFGLDQAPIRAAVAAQPQLLTWVINTPDLQRLRQVAGFEIGAPTRLARDGLEWEFALPDDGRLHDGGMLPYCIQWHSQPHPSRAMADLGCRLHALTLHHNRPGWLAARLESLGASKLVEIEPLPDTEAPRLTAEIRVPNGEVVTLSSR